MSRFDDAGIFWTPEHYQGRASKKEKATQAPRTLPPIPDTGWKPRLDLPDLSASKFIGIDTETRDDDLLDKGPGTYRGAHIVGVSVAVDDWSCYYPLRHTIGENLDPVPVYAWLREQLSRFNQSKIGAHILYDLEFLAAEGIEVKGNCYDVQYADPLIDEYARSYSLESIAQRRLGESKETSLLYRWCADAYGGEANGKQRANIWRAPSELVGPYAEQDARLPVRILIEQWKILRERKMLQIFEMECKLIPLLLKMRQLGVPINLETRQRVDDELSEHIDTLQKQVGLNVYAAAEIKLLCEKEGIEFPLTDKGAPSFTKQWLKNNPHPAMKRITELRGYYRLRDAFLRSAMLGTQVDGSIHAEFHPLRSDEYGAVSARFSSSNPNLQQVPVRDKVWGPRVRSCFVPTQGRRWGKLDLQQIEYRLGVHYGTGEGVEAVRDQYRNDHKTDFYAVAMQFTGLERDPTKSISLGTLYGMREKKFALMTGVSLERAYELFAQFNARLPFMRATYEAAIVEAEESGYVTTIGGRICHIDHRHTHKALNRKLQSSCADWIKRSMVTAHIQGVFDILEPYLTVHDELDVGIPRSREGMEAMRELHSIMVGAYNLNIPVLASIGIGQSWGELQNCEPEDLGFLAN